MAYKSQPTVTRPANVTAYSAGDVVGGVITFPGAGPDNGVVLLTSADLAIATATVPTGMASMRQHLYSQTPPSNFADNAIWTLTAADRPYYLGYVDVGSPAVMGAAGATNLFTQADGLQKAIRMYGQTLYGYLVTIAGYTPAANSEVYTPSLTLVDL